MQKVVIDVEGRFTDGISGKAGAAINAVERLARTKVFVKFDANNSPFLKAINAAEKRAKQLGRTKIAATLNAVDKATRVMGKVWNFGIKIGGAVWRATVSVVDKATAPIRAIIRMLKLPVLRAGAALGLNFRFENMLETYTSFESMMDKVGAISGATNKDMDMLTAKAKERGAATKFTATEAGEAMSYMAMAGWEPDQMMKGIDGIMSLSAASGESLGATSDIVTDALTAFGLTPDDSNHFADVLAAASSNSNTNVGLMGETFKYAATQAGALSYDIKDVALSAGLMANAGVKGSMSGTALANIWTRLATNTGGAADAIRAVGVEFYDQYGKARKWRDVLKELRVATAGMTDEQKSNLAYTVAGIRGQKGLLPLLNASADDYKKLADAVDEADGAAKRMERRMMGNLDGSVKLLQSAAEGAKLTVMEKFAPYLRSFVDWLASKMPGIGNTVGNALQTVSDKIQNAFSRIREITHDPDFKNASLGEKISMLWNGVVFDPLKDWWENGGHDSAIQTANSIGKSLGEILKTVLLTVFGMTDILQGDGLGESAGASIAQSFAKGFAEGFDASLVGEKLKEALGNVMRGLGNLWDSLPGWGKLLTGGIITSKAVGGISQGVLNALILAHGAKSVIGSPASGAGLLGFGANAAITLGAGNLANNGSMSARALSALGLGSVAGGLVTGAGVLHAGKSFARAIAAYKNDDKNTGNAELARGGLTTAGIGVGALAGAKFGASVGALGGPAGALIGAGVGTVAGWFAGDRLANYLMKTEESAKGTQEAIEQTKSPAEKLEAISDNLKRQFGDMELSSKEVSRLAQQITWGDSLKSADRFAQASQDAANSLTAMQTAANSTDRWMWKAGLGVTFDENEIADIENSFEDYANSAQSYLENKHYEFTAAAELFMDINEGEGKSFVDSSSAYFTNLEGQVKGLSDQLTKNINDFLQNDGKLEIQYNADGSVKLDEPGIIADLQKQIADIIRKVGEAENAANESLLDLKFGGRKLSFESFSELNSELQNSNASAFETTDAAYKSDYSGLHVEYNDSATTPERRTELDSELNYLNQGYVQEARARRNRTETRLKDSLSNTYGKGLSDRLWGGIQESLKSGINPMKWSTEDVQKLIGSNSLSDGAADAYKEVMGEVYNTLTPLQIGEQSLNPTLKTDFDVQPDESIADKVQQVVGAEQLQADMSIIANTSWEFQEVGDPGSEIAALVSGDGKVVVPFTALAQVGWELGGTQLEPSLLSPDKTIEVPITAEAAVEWNEIKSNMPSIPKLDPSSMAMPDLNLSTKANVSIESSTVDVSNIVSQIEATELPAVDISADANVTVNYTNSTPFDPSSMSPPITDVGGPYSAQTSVNVASAYTNNKFEGRQVEDFGVQTSYDFETQVNINASYFANKFSGLRSDFGIQSSYSVSTTVSINVGYSVNKGAVPDLAAGIPRTASVKRARGGIIGPDGPIGFANGGMVRGGPQIVTVAEEGTPEMIIPLGSQRRKRGMQLWERAGRMLGVPGFAEGGIAGRVSEPVRFPRSKPVEMPRFRRASSENANSNICVNVGGVTLNIEVQSEKGDVVAGIEKHKDEVADVIAGVIRQGMSEVFINSPKRGGETV